MNKSEKIDEWIDRFNDNELSDGELKDFMELLANDPALRAEVRLDKDLNELLEDEGLLTLRKKILEIRKSRETRGRDKKIILLAAAVVVILFFSVILYFVIDKNTGENELLQTNKKPAKEIPINIKSPPAVITGNDNPEKQQSRNDSLLKSRSGGPDKQNQPLIAANYKLFPPFESLIGTHIRSEDFKLTEPSAGSHFNQESTFTFSWETDITLPLRLEIMDNQGKLIFDSHPVHDKSLKLPSGTFKQGLYYFKVLKEDQLLFFGKFTI